MSRACGRYGIKFPSAKATTKLTRKPVPILLGGKTSERQVSLMSGTNVWLKLRGSKKYEPQPYLLDLQGAVWKLPYAFCLNHTVEEIVENCEHAEQAHERLGYLEQKVKMRLALSSEEVSEINTLPTKLTMSEFLKVAPFVFIALHGGEGENGVLQKTLADKGILFNGPDSKVSELCADKWNTNTFIESLHISGVTTTLGKVMKFSDIESKNTKQLWEDVKKQLNAQTVIVKPRTDGCSSGVVHLYSESDLQKYLKAVKNKITRIPQETFANQANIIEMPLEGIEELLFEKFIETDTVKVVGNTLKHIQKSGLLEITVGVVEEKGKLKVLNPSLTVAVGEVLSVEEKFQGGTGINITPPPESIISATALARTKKLIKSVADGIGIKGYSRIDTFINTHDGSVVIIEVNTLPGLTPSTVLYHQGLAENKPIFPRELLEKLIENKGY